MDCIKRGYARAFVHDPSPALGALTLFSPLDEFPTLFQAVFNRYLDLYYSWNSSIGISLELVTSAEISDPRPDPLNQDL